MAERVNVSESKKGSKFPWDFIIFIISIAGSAYGNFFRVYNATNLTPGDKFFYFLTIMWYLYFPGMFAEYYGNPEKSNKSNKFLNFWKKGKSIYPLIWTFTFAPIGLEEISYFISIVVVIIVIDIVGLFYIFTFFDTEEEKKARIFRIVLLILLSVFSILGQFFFAFTRVSPLRIILFEVLWTLLIASYIRRFLLKYMKGKNTKDEYKIPRVMISYAATFLIISLLFLSTGPLTVSNRAPIIAIRTDSMKPFINAGDLVFIVYFDPIDIQNNSVIAYYSENLYNASEPITVHRVIDKWSVSGKWYFQTCGDNNSEIDHYVVEEDLIYGVYWFKIGGVGQIFLDLADMNIIPILIIGAIIIFLIAIGAGFGIYFWRSRKLKHEKSLNQI